jgi:hypothetical protein
LNGVTKDLGNYSAKKNAKNEKKDLTGVLAIFLEFSLPPTSHFISTQKSSLPDVIAKFYSRNSMPAPNI